MRDTIELIARQLTMINISSLSCAEANICKILLNSGYLEKRKDSEEEYYICPMSTKS